MRLPFSYLLRILAGAVFGLYMGHLLYYLNPQIEITPGRLLTLTLVYGLICGVIFGSILWLLRAFRARMMRQAQPSSHGFGLVVGACFVSALVYWVHLAMFRIYLPRGAIRVLSNATSIIAATAFLLLILWLIERNASRKTSRAIILIGVVLIAISSFFLHQRRENYRQDMRAPVVATVAAPEERRSIVVVTIRNLPYDWIVTAGAEGRLPFLSELVQRSFFTRVEPFRSSSPKALWASLATGKLPHRHSVTGRFSYRTPLNPPGERFLLVPGWIGFRGWGLVPPVERISAPLPSGESFPFWQIFHKLNLETAVINWPSSHATPPTADLLVSDRFFTGAAENTVGPARLSQPMRALSIEPRQLTKEDLRPFAALRSTSRANVFRALASDLSTTQIASSLLREKTYELVALSLNGLADLELELGLKENALPGRDSDRGPPLRAYLERIDEALREIAEAAEGSLLVIISPCGPAPPPLPMSPLAAFNTLSGLDDPGIDDGFIILAGDWSNPVEHPEPVEVVDAVPTILFAARLPVARDMDGRAVTEAFSSEFLRENALSLIQTYESERLTVRSRP